MPLIDLTKIKNKKELFEEAFEKLQKNSECLIISFNHFQSGSFAHIDCFSNIHLQINVAADSYARITNNICVHEERVYNREDKKLIYRTAAI